jgi:hypothetical protein
MWYNGCQMSKKRRKDKKTRKHSSINTRPQKTTEPVAGGIFDVRPDLKKTAILTAVCLLILSLLYLTQSRWPLRP